MATLNPRLQAAGLLLRARPSMVARPVAPWRIPGSMIALARSFSHTRAQNTVVGSMKRRYEAQLARQTQNRPVDRNQASKSGRESMALDSLTGSLSIATYVTPPVRRFPASFNFAWTLTKRRFLDWLTLFLFSWGSKPKFLKAATWKPQRFAIVSQAKALHRTMGEALAAGDKHTLRTVCIPALARKLEGVIDSRPRGVRKSWELVRYNQTWRYPRLGDRKLRVTAEPTLKDLPAIYQAVVSIASRQRLVEYDDSPVGGGRVVPGSEKEVDVVEHLVLISTVDSKTYQQTAWKIWGTIKETTAESLEYEEQTMAQAQNASIPSR